MRAQVRNEALPLKGRPATNKGEEEEGGAGELGGNSENVTRRGGGAGGAVWR